MEVKNGNSLIFGNRMTFPVKHKVMIEMLDDEGSLHYNLGKASLSSAGNNGGDPSNIAAEALEGFGEFNNVKVKRKLNSSPVKELPLKSISRPNYAAEVEKGQKITIVKARECHASRTQGALFYSVENGKLRGDKIYLLPKDREHVTGEADYSKLKVGHEAPCHEYKETSATFQDEKPIVRGKKIKGSQSDNKTIVSRKDWLRIVACIAGKDKKISSHDIPPSKKKLPALASGKHLIGLGNRLDGSESLNGEWNHPEAPLAGSQRDASATLPAVEDESVSSNPREMNAMELLAAHFLMQL